MALPGPRRGGWRDGCSIMMDGVSRERLPVGRLPTAGVTVAFNWTRGTRLPSYLFSPKNPLQTFNTLTTLVKHKALDKSNILNVIPHTCEGHVLVVITLSTCYLCCPQSLGSGHLIFMWGTEELAQTKICS